MNRKGSITIFLSLCLSVCILFANVLLESARSALLGAYADAAVETSLCSLFSCYDSNVYDEFGILLLNEQDLPGQVSADSLFTKYLRINLDPKAGGLLFGGHFLRTNLLAASLTDKLNAIDSGGEYFGRAVLDYMKYRSLTSLFEKLTGQEETVRTGEEIKKENTTSQTPPEPPGDTGETGWEKDKEAGRTEKKAGEQNGGETEETQEDYQELVDESILGSINRLRKEGVLRLVVPSEELISKKATDAADFPSRTAPLFPAPSFALAGPVERALYAEYVMEYFSEFTDASENPVLQYEMEYILAGNRSDRANLEEVVDRVVLMREGLNLVTLERSRDRMKQAEGFANALVGWLGLPAVTFAVKAMTVGAWSYAESVIDARTLLSGGKVPLDKKTEEWTVELADLPVLVKGGYKKTGQSARGLCYEEYLRLLLLAETQRNRYLRTMDMVQCRMRLIKADFRMSDCIFGAGAEAAVSSHFLFLSQRRTAGGSVRMVGGSRVY